MRHHKRPNPTAQPLLRIMLCVLVVLASAAVSLPSAGAKAVVLSKRPKAQQFALLPHTYQLPAARHDVTAPTPRLAPDDVWPLASEGTVTAAARSASLPAGDGSGPAVRIAATPLTVASLDAATTLRARVFDHASALRAGVTGVLFTVTRVSSTSADIAVSVNYSSFQRAYGANFGGRLVMVSLPACALTTPQVAECRVQTPMTATNDGVATTVTTTLTSSASSPAARPASRATAAELPGIAGSSVVLAAVSGPASSSGAFTATSLRPSGTWSTSGNSGSFDWSYPIIVPPPAAGADVAPQVALSYDSGSVDGQIPSSNNESSWVGQGWDYSPGYIERTYRTCADDTTLPTKSQTNDECWAGQIVTMNLNGSSTALVFDASTQQWHPVNDSGQRVTLTGTATGPYAGEYWTVTTTDGTTYYFGRNSLPGGATTNSAWTTPVYGGHSSDPCYSTAGFAQSSCTQAWRWNLDFVQDSHGNTASYFYTRESNYYGANDSTTPVAYNRGGYLTRISYGQQLTGTSPNQTLTPAMAPEKITFSINDRRCSLTSDHSGCDANDDWPDIPQDQICTSTGACDNHAPTFFSSKMLTGIQTAYSTGTAYHTVDSYALGQTFPAGEANPALTLESVSRTAYGTSGTGLLMPSVTFKSTPMDNRVPGIPNGNSDPFLQDRLTQIDTETGERISIDYDQANYAPTPCSSSNYPSVVSKDTMECFPVVWTPPDSPKTVNDLFHKHLVTEVDEQDANGTAPTRVFHYSYLGGAGWRYDDNEVLKPADRTWGQFRGYAQVQVRTGNPNDSPNADEHGAPDDWTLTTTTYYRGMNGNRNQDGSYQSGVMTSPDSLGAQVLDNNEYAGQPRDVQTFIGNGTGNNAVGSELSSTITTLSTLATTATRSRGSTLAPLTATAVAVTTTQVINDLAAGGTRGTTTTDQYDSAYRLVRQSDAGDSVPTVCTATSYADNTTSWIRTLPSETAVYQAACPANSSTPVPGTILADTRHYYDQSTTLGAVGSTGDLTQVKAATTGSGGTISVWATSAATFDPAGRPLSQTRYASSADRTGETTTLSYTQTAGGQLATTTTSNALNQNATVTVDPARGLPTKTVDIAGHTTTARYDQVGRLTAVWEPGQQGSNTATTTYSYQYGPSAPLAVTINTLVDPGGGATPAPVTSVRIYDAFGALRQTQTAAPPQPGEPTVEVVTDTFTDSHGWTVRTYDRWNTSGAPDSTKLLDPTLAVDSQTLTTYDDAGRPVSVAVYAGTTNSTTTTLVSTSQTIYSGDSTTLIPPAGGVEQTSYSDVRGNTTELDEWTSPPAFNHSSLNGGTGSAQKTTYQYTALNQRSSMRDAAGSNVDATWTWTYDLAGRVNVQTDPDSGTTTTAYNDLNEVTSTSSGGRTLAYDYDGADRKLDEYQGAIGGTKLASWKYDTVQPGQLTSSTRYTTGGNYTTTATGYDGAGNLQGTSLTVPANLPGFGGSTFTTSYTWTSTNLLSGVTPASIAASGISDETESITYDSYGNAFSVRSDIGGDYVDNASYSPYGQPLIYQLGTNRQSAWFNYTYDVQSGLPVEDNYSAQQALPQINDMKYSYDAAHNITKTVETQGSGTSAPVQTACYQYDSLDELTQAWSANDGCAADPSSANVQGADTAQTFWDTWAFDKAGDRNRQTQHAVPGSAASTTTYSIGVTSHIHALAQTTTTGRGAGSETYTYNADGGTATNTTAIGTQSFGYDAEGRTSSVTTPTGATGSNMTYDADGNQLLRVDAASSTLYLPGEELTYTPENNIYTGTRYYTINGTTVGERVYSTAPGYIGNANPIYLFTDRLGTGTIESPTDSSGVLPPNRRHFDPYGNIIGSGATTWLDQHGYLNQPADTATTLDEFGARQYDPTTGRFLSLDPLLVPSDPTSLNGYSYADNNPITNKDPNGMLCQNGPDGMCWVNHSVTAILAGDQTTYAANSNLASGNEERQSDSDTTKRNDDGKIYTWEQQEGLAESDAAATPDPVSAWIEKVLEGAFYAALHPAKTAKQVAEDAANAAEACFSKLDGKGCVNTALLAASVIPGVGEATDGTRIAEAAEDAGDAAVGAADTAGDGAATVGRDAAKSCLNSFTADTPVTLADGEQEPISKVKVGDKVLATDPETGQTKAEPVVQLIRHSGQHAMVLISLADGSMLDSTDGHPIWDATTQAFVDASELRAGDKIETSTGQLITITALAGYTADLTAYNLQITTIHTYYAGATPVLVHNSCDPSVTFGHGARHLAGTGLSDTEVESAIQSHVEQSVANASLTGSFFGRVTVRGIQVEYRAYTLANGTINVGTYYVP